MKGQAVLRIICIILPVQKKSRFRIYTEIVERIEIMAAAQLVLHGMVLSAMPVGESDRRIVLLTKERGKISAFARRARKSNSPLLAKCQPFALGEFSFYEGRDSYTLIQAEISRYFEELQEDLEAVSYGCYFCEFAGYFARENLEAEKLLDLLYVTISMLVEKRFSYPLLRRIFEWKILVLEGEASWVFDCISCHKKEGPFYFSYAKGGILCGECICTQRRTKKEQKAEKAEEKELPEGVRLALEYVTISPINRVYGFQIGAAAADSFLDFVHSYVRKMVVHDFKSLKMIDLAK